ncbi:MAG: bifunctional nuclease family protein [Sedimentisphaerales bacterium]|nr:bifunctional nuclease family protein [Sedimentisphaerales bacterium]
MNIAMELSRLVIQENSESQFIFLKEIDGTRSFPIVIGTAEALAIDYRLKGLQFPRPMTHDLVQNVIDAMGGKLEQIIVNDLREHTFFAKLIISRDGETIEVDSRPSDAVAISVVQRTPIFVAQHVLEQACQ